jgi:hypothetical protein
MKRQHLLLLAWAPLLALAALGIYSTWRPEPRYLGRGLSAWVRDLGADQIERRVQAAAAVKHIGSLAVPYLVERLGPPRHVPRRESSLARWWRTTSDWLSAHTRIKLPAPSRSDPRREALASLDALGPQAKEALPALEKLLRERPPDPCAVYVAARIGSAALPLLTRALTNDAQVVRLQARLCLDMMKAHDELLCPKIASGPEASSFERRCCELNLRTLQRAFRQYRAQHPEKALPQNIFDTPPPSPTLPPNFSPEALQRIRQDIARSRRDQGKRNGGTPQSGLE